MRARFIVFSLGLAVLAALLAGWIRVVGVANPLSAPLSRLLPWPVACTTRGCITTAQWHQHEKARATFNHATGLPQAPAADTLTTIMRQHLVRHASVRESVTPADARRYREEILNAKDAASLREATTLTQDEYDRLVVLPFLQQEALRQQRRVETTDELFIQLAQDRWVFVFVRGLQWNREEGRVTSTQ